MTVPGYPGLLVFWVYGSILRPGGIKPFPLSPQVVEYLERDLGVQVQRVSVHKMKYSFQIWSAMMSSKDSDGQVGEVAQAKAGRRGGSALCSSNCGELQSSQTCPEVFCAPLLHEQKWEPRGTLLLQ